MKREKKIIEGKSRGTSEYVKKICIMFDLLKIKKRFISISAN